MIEEKVKRNLRMFLFTDFLLYLSYKLFSEEIRDFLGFKAAFHLFSSNLAELYGEVAYLYVLGIKDVENFFYSLDLNDLKKVIASLKIKDNDNSRVVERINKILNDENFKKVFEYFKENKHILDRVVETIIKHCPKVLKEYNKDIELSKILRVEYSKLRDLTFSFFYEIPRELFMKHLGCCIITLKLDKIILEFEKENKVLVETIEF